MGRVAGRWGDVGGGEEEEGAVEDDMLDTRGGMTMEPTVGVSRTKLEVV